MVLLFFFFFDGDEALFYYHIDVCVCMCMSIYQPQIYTTVYTHARSCHAMYVAKRRS